MSQGKRGQVLENLVDYTNNVYRNKGMALIDKVPTPWNVSYNRRTGKVYNAFPEKKGTVDYVGISHGRSIAFDAKSTDNRTSFPLKNVKDHQVKYLRDYQDQGGIAFIIVCFDKHKEHYLLKVDDLYMWWVGAARGQRKSIPHDWFVANCQLIKNKKGIPLDYLEQCEAVFKKYAK